MKQFASRIRNVSFHARRQAFRAPASTSRGYVTTTSPPRQLSPFVYGAVGIAVGAFTTAGFLDFNHSEIKETLSAPSYADKLTMLKV